MRKLTIEQWKEISDLCYDFSKKRSELLELLQKYKFPKKIFEPYEFKIYNNFIHIRSKLEEVLFKQYPNISIPKGFNYFFGEKRKREELDRLDMLKAMKFGPSFAPERIGIVELPRKEFKDPALRNRMMILKFNEDEDDDIE